jgi:hypothetical protein
MISPTRCEAPTAGRPGCRLLISERGVCNEVSRRLCVGSVAVWLLAASPRGGLVKSVRVSVGRGMWPVEEGQRRWCDGELTASCVPLGFLRSPRLQSTSIRLLVASYATPLPAISPCA